MKGPLAVEDKSSITARSGPKNGNGNSSSGKKPAWMDSSPGSPTLSIISARRTTPKNCTDRPSGYTCPWVLSSLYTPKSPVMRTSQPVSSRHSRTAASIQLSPGSTPPPGNPQVASSARCVSKIRLASSSTTTPQTGRGIRAESGDLLLFAVIPAFF